MELPLPSQACSEDGTSANDERKRKNVEYQQRRRQKLKVQQSQLGILFIKAAD